MELETKSKSKQVFDDFCAIRRVAELMLVEKGRKKKPVPEIGNRTEERSGPFPSTPQIVCVNDGHI